MFKMVLVAETPGVRVWGTAFKAWTRRSSQS